MFFITNRRELNHDFSAKVPQYQARQTEDKKYHSWICFMCIIAVVCVACTKCDWNNSSITVKVHFGVLHKKRKLQKNQSVLKSFYLASISTHIAIMISTKPSHWFLPWKKFCKNFPSLIFWLTLLFLNLDAHSLISIGAHSVLSHVTGSWTEALAFTLVATQTLSFEKWKISYLLKDFFAYLENMQQWK